jgi:hypothetical protein
MKQRRESTYIVLAQLITGRYIINKHSVPFTSAAASNATHGRRNGVEHEVEP